MDTMSFWDCEFTICFFFLKRWCTASSYSETSLCSSGRFAKKCSVEEIICAMSSWIQAILIDSISFSAAASNFSISCTFF